MDIFTNGFVLLTVCCALMHFYTRANKDTQAPRDHVAFSRFQRLYLTVYLLAVFGDWLQGPHVYALYQSYEMTKHQIEILFITGFGSSLVFGTLVGSFADKCGRRFNCILYGFLYSFGCLTKHFNNFYVLMFGRLLAGISTSILYSAFESWLIYEHRQRGFEQHLLGNIFTNAYFGNSVVAILAGVVAQVVSNSFGYVAPFDTSLLVLVCMTLFVFRNWSENHGDANAHLKQSFTTAWFAIRTDRKVLFLGLIQSLFEGSMYMFVLEWTPALTNSSLQSSEQAISLPHGYIFSAYMVAVMIGSNLFRILIKHQTCDQFMRHVLFTSAASLTVPFLFPTNQLLIFMAFIVFEMCVGIFWPAMGTLRSSLVPEVARSTIMNFFRIPLNAIVVLILLQDLQLAVIFKFCVCFLALSTVCMVHLRQLIASDQSAATGCHSI